MADGLDAIRERDRRWTDWGQPTTAYRDRRTLLAALDAQAARHPEAVAALDWFDLHLGHLPDCPCPAHVRLAEARRALAEPAGEQP